MKTFKIIAFYLILLILLIAGISIDLSAKNNHRNRNYPRELPKLSSVLNKHENRKVHRKYSQRAKDCRRIQLQKQTKN